MKSEQQPKQSISATLIDLLINISVLKFLKKKLKNENKSFHSHKIMNHCETERRYEWFSNQKLTLSVSVSLLSRDCGALQVMMESLVYPVSPVNQDHQDIQHTQE